MNPGPKSIDELHEMASRPTKAVIDSVKAIDSNVLVIGAGGKMGFHLSRMLQRALTNNHSPFRAIAVSRFAGPEATQLFDEQGIETISTDLMDPDAVESLPDSRNVFYLAGVKFGTSDDRDLLQKMNVDLPRRVANHFSNANIVALSTGCVYEFTSPSCGGSVESDPTNPCGQYAVSCVGREQAFIESETRTSLIRLNYSVDLRYGVLVDIAQRVLQRQPVDVTTPYVNVIWQGDANAHIIQALPSAASPPQFFNVTGQAILSVRQVGERFAELFDQPLLTIGTEQETAWLSNARRSHQLWGEPQINEDVLIRWVAEWLLAGGETLNKPTQFQIRDGQY